MHLFGNGVSSQETEGNRKEYEITHQYTHNKKRIDYNKSNTVLHKNLSKM